MLYATAREWRDAPQKRLLLFGMSGLGKTHLSALLRARGDWFHYSIDYRIGTRYMGEYIADNAKVEAMRVPFLRELLMSDSIYIGSNLSFNNLKPVSAYLGKPGNPDLGGLDFDEFRRRQGQFRRSEELALQDTGYFAERAQRLYDYPHFVCDTGGSICEWVAPDNPGDEILTHLSGQTLMAWIRGDDEHIGELVRRFDRDPKPMAYGADFLAKAWTDYLSESGVSEREVDPDAFIRWTYDRALAHRQPIYEAMARNWGVTIPAADAAGCRDADDVVEAVARALFDRESPP